MNTFVMSVLVYVAIFLAIGWLVASFQYVKSDEVAIRSRFGTLGNKILRSGLTFLPWFPGIKLVRITTKQIPFQFDGALEHRVWSSDRQGLLVDLSGYVRFPYEDLCSLKLMIRSGVPTEAAALGEWMEDEVVAGLRDIMAGFSLEQSIGRSNLRKIRTRAEKFFRDSSGLFVKSGLCGSDPENLTPGTGEVIVRVEQVNPTAEMQRAMQAPIAAKYRANAAKETAKQAAEEVGGQIIGIVARQHGMTIEQLERDLKDHPEKRGTSVANGGYSETFNYAQDQVKRDRAAANGELSDIRVGATDGSALSGDLGPMAAFAGLFSRSMGGGRSNRGGDRRSGGRPGRRANQGEEREALSEQDVARLSKTMPVDDLARHLMRDEEPEGENDE